MQGWMDFKEGKEGDYRDGLINESKNEQGGKDGSAGKNHKNLEEGRLH